jgi:hypothetical protein
MSESKEKKSTRQSQRLRGRKEEEEKDDDDENGDDDHEEEGDDDGDAPPISSSNSNSNSGNEEKRERKVSKDDLDLEETFRMIIKQQYQQIQATQSNSSKKNGEQKASSFGCYGVMTKTHSPDLRITGLYSSVPLPLSPSIAKVRSFPCFHSYITFRCCLQPQQRTNGRVTE